MTCRFSNVKERKLDQNLQVLNEDLKITGTKMKFQNYINLILKQLNFFSNLLAFKIEIVPNNSKTINPTCTNDVNSLFNCLKVS